MRALVVLSDRFSEIEAFTVIDVLRRAAIDVTVAGLASKMVEGSHKTRVFADKKLDEVRADSYDAIVLPGGPGYRQMMNSKMLLGMTADFNKKGKLVAAICAAPLVLAKSGVLEKRTATVYPGLERFIPRPRDGKVVVDGNVVTAKSPGAAVLFSLKIVEMMSGKGVASKVRESLVME